MKLIIILFILVTTKLFAGRPVINQISRTELINESNFIFIGWPSQLTSTNNCPQSIGKWQVHKVFKGDKSFEGKIVSIAPSNYKLKVTSENSKGSGYAQKNYKNGTIDFDQSSSILFTKLDQYNCFELSANGAQEHRFKEIEIESLTSNDCPLSERAFNLFTNSLPKNCTQDSDCEAFNLHPDTCSKQIVLNKSAKNQLTENFHALVGSLTKNCNSNWASNKCNPTTIPAMCKHNVCMEGLNSKAIANLLSFKIASMSSSCAPHDDTSVMISISNSTSNYYPSLNVNWWGANRIKFIKGTYLLSDENLPALQNKKFSASFCPYQSRCKQLKKLNLKINLETDSNGKLFFEFTTVDDEKFNGTVPINLKENKEMVICG